jgi:ZIP family zinc transporter
VPAPLARRAASPVLREPPPRIEAAMALLTSTIAGLLTSVGAVPPALGRSVAPLWRGILLGLAAGAMLAVTALELWPAAWELGGFGSLVLGTLAGMLALHLAERSLARHAAGDPMALVFLIGLGLHNIPEGMAIGAGHHAGGSLGLAVAVAIGLHNLPEGLAAGLLLAEGGRPPARVLAAVTLVGLCTPLGTLAGLAWLAAQPAMVGFLLAFAAGAMLFLGALRLLPAALADSRGWAIAGAVAALPLALLH